MQNYALVGNDGNYKELSECERGRIIGDEGSEGFILERNGVPCWII